MALTKLPSVFRKSTIKPNSPVTVNGVSSTKDNGIAKEQATAPSGSVIRDFRDQIKKGTPVTLNMSTFAAVVDFLKNKESINDRNFLLEKGLIFVARSDGRVSRALQNGIVELLYNDLGHPPATRLGNDYTLRPADGSYNKIDLPEIGKMYAWRTADGSYNNIDLPEMGKAGNTYARSVQQSHPVPKNQLPDPDLIFDTLLRREGVSGALLILTFG